LVQKTAINFGILLLAVLAAVPLCGESAPSMKSEDHRLGHWLTDDQGLPAFDYTGVLPFDALQKNGTKLDAPEDPYFMLGNYRFHMFVHVSGIYQLLSGERSWLRLNQPDKPNYGENHSVLEVRSTGGAEVKEFTLTGLNSLARDPSRTRRVFGTGFAYFQYALDDGLVCERVISVRPSATPYDGVSAFVLTVRLANTGNKMLHLRYRESVLARVVPIQLQSLKPQNWPFRYVNSVVEDSRHTILKADVKAETGDPLLFGSAGQPSFYDGFSPSLFIKVFANDTVPGQLRAEKTSSGDDLLGATYELTLKPGERRQFELVIGYSSAKSFAGINELCRRLQSSNSDHISLKTDFTPRALFRAEWKKKLPDFAGETDPVLRREMTWNAFCLETLANYSSFYRETQMPQGTHYTFAWGENSSARDQFQIGLPLSYIDPPLARSNLRYMMKRTTALGEIRLIEDGYGVSTNSFFSPSDQQIYYFEALADYLRVTGDYKFLLEQVGFYPEGSSRSGDSIDRIEMCFKYLRDIIGTGPHGLIHMRYADWNDEAMYFFKDVSYADFWTSAESHLDSAMASVVLNNLAMQLDQAAANPSFATRSSRLNRLTQSIREFQSGVRSAFLNELGNRSFSLRCRVNQEVMGDTKLFLEPQGYALQMPEISLEQKRRIFAEIEKRVMSGEVMGARLAEEFIPNPYGDPMISTGLFWWSMNGPLILGVDSFDHQAAWGMLRKMTFENHADNFPTFWEGYWTASDALGSSKMPYEGAIPSPFPAFCGHAHAWPLYCYYRLRESRKRKSAVAPKQLLH